MRADWDNGNGTYNGAKFMAAMTGLSEKEITWTFERLKYLMHTEGRTKEEASAIVKEETKDTPWLDS